MTSAGNIELAWSNREGRECLRLLGWTKAELRLLGVLSPGDLAQCIIVLPSDLVEPKVALKNLRPSAGRLLVEGDAVWFVPRFPFFDGLSYSVVMLPPATTRVLTIQKAALSRSPETDVVAIYPSCSEVPVNLLKLYIRFSRPMSEGWASRAVLVRRAKDGMELRDVFLVGQELWDPERRRLTLLLDPGRIKRGLVPNQEAGYPLVEGVPIIVCIDAAFRDAEGRPLRSGAERRYRVDRPLRARVDPRRWRFRWPGASTSEPLALEFDVPLDHALLEHSLWVHDGAGAAVAGQGASGPNEASWRFSPSSPWTAGKYEVRIDPRLEDLAGNSLVRMFDTDLLDDGARLPEKRSMMSVRGELF